MPQLPNIPFPYSFHPLPAQPRNSPFFPFHSSFLPPHPHPTATLLQARKLWLGHRPLRVPSNNCPSSQALQYQSIQVSRLFCRDPASSANRTHIPLARDFVWIGRGQQGMLLFSCQGLVFKEATSYLSFHFYHKHLPPNAAAAAASPPPPPLPPFFGLSVVGCQDLQLKVIWKFGVYFAALLLNMYEGPSVSLALRKNRGINNACHCFAEN